MNAIIDWFLVWWLCSGRYLWSTVRRRLFEHHYLSTALPTVSSLEKVKVCLKQITWTMDGPLHLFDCISYPQTTWVKKKDDCDGFASLAAALITQYDSSSNPVLVTVMVRPIRSSHTVCAFRTSKETLCFFDNDRLRCENCQKYEDIIALITKNTKRLIAWDVRNPATFEMVEFHKM